MEPAAAVAANHAQSSKHVVFAHLMYTTHVACLMILMIMVAIVIPMNLAILVIILNLMFCDSDKVVSLFKCDLANCVNVESVRCIDDCRCLALSGRTLR